MFDWLQYNIFTSNGQIVHTVEAKNGKEHAYKRMLPFSILFFLLSYRCPPCTHVTLTYVTVA